MGLSVRKSAEPAHHLRAPITSLFPSSLFPSLVLLLMLQRVSDAFYDHCQMGYVESLILTFFLVRAQWILFCFAEQHPMETMTIGFFDASMLPRAWMKRRLFGVVHERDSWALLLVDGDRFS
ncbi:hypothetical protein MRB53_018503 [Persea americana]|uniref:Uncharacterized protein n=1 Tax=Persea americana TaxID=3435 RepID=A0ACC2M869_PERAE|nr:hypothetical protein MRB53_018503 [Persea americana]